MLRPCKFVIDSYAEQSYVGHQFYRVVAQYESVEGASLRSRRSEVVGTRRNGRARRRHAKGEGVRARKVHENRFPPPTLLPGSRCVICQKFWQKTTDHAQTKRAAKKRGTFYLRSKYICYTDQLGYLIVERWSNKLMVNAQLSIVFNNGHNK